MYIEPFKVEIWMNAWETRCTYNLAETCVASLTLDELLVLCGRNSDDLTELLPMKMTYGDIEGSPRLRRAISRLYEDQPISAITVTHGTIAANMLVHKSIVSAGDHTIAIVPTYQQHSAIPESLGAQVDRLPLTEANGFLPDLDALHALITTDTRLIALTNPNNPTGAMMDRAHLEDLADIARSVGAYILCDEVYRGTGQIGDGMGPSIVDVYEKGIATAGMSKAYSLAGLRVGWIVAPPDVTEQILIHRDYDTIAVGKINDHLAALALEHKDALLARSQKITRDNLALLTAWVEQEPRVTWTRPRAGTTAMLKVDVPGSSRDFCLGLLKDTGVMLTPGDAFDMEGYVRIGYANRTEVVRDGLAALSTYLRNISG